MPYTDQEKTTAIVRYKQGVSAQKPSSEYGVSQRTIYRLAKIYKAVNPSERDSLTVKEYDMLMRWVTKPENIISILKSVNCTAHAPLKEKLCELKLLYGQYDVHTLCKALDVSRGTFYNHILRNKRGNAWLERRREEYRILIRNVFDEYRQILGADEICAVLVQRGHRVSREYVAKLMREMGLSSIRTTAKQDYRKLHGEERKENVLQQQFHVDKFNQVWVSDVTF